MELPYFKFRTFLQKNEREKCDNRQILENLSHYYVFSFYYDVTEEGCEDLDNLTIHHYRANSEKIASISTHNELRLEQYLSLCRM